jgi:hypothetical protein
MSLRLRLNCRRIAWKKLSCANVRPTGTSHEDAADAPASVEKAVV